VAIPDPFKLPVPSVTASSRNVTVPVGVPVVVGVTVAVKVTDCPNTDGFVAEESAVSVAPGLTVCVRAADVLPAKLASPPYTAVMGWVPTVSVVVVKVATAAPFSVPVPRVVPPSLNVTVPVGVPAPAVTVNVAVNVTDCPKLDGFTEEVSALLIVPCTLCVNTADVLPAKLVSPP